LIRSGIWQWARSAIAAISFGMTIRAEPARCNRVIGCAAEIAGHLIVCAHMSIIA